MVGQSVKLVSMTPDAEKLILYCARVSSNQENESVGLLKYLVKHEHWSPFEMAHAVFEINTSRAIAAQILRHRSFSFQEFSQRYSTPDAYQQYRARRQADKNRQSSIDDLDDGQVLWFNYAQERIWAESISLYEEAVERGISRESARFILPLNTATRLYMAGSIRSWIHYCDLRTKPDVQLEHRILAQMMKAILAINLPNTAEALGWAESRS